MGRAIVAAMLLTLCGCRMVPEVKTEFAWAGTFAKPADVKQAALKAQGECTLAWMEKVNFREGSARVAALGALIVDAQYSHPLALALHLFGRHNLGQDFKGYIEACMASKGYKPKATDHVELIRRSVYS